MSNPVQERTLPEQYADQSWYERFSSNHEFSLAFGISCLVNLLVFLLLGLFLTVRTEKDRTAVEVEVIQIEPETRLENSGEQNTADNELEFTEADASEEFTEIEAPEIIENPNDINANTELTTEIRNQSPLNADSYAEQTELSEKVESAIGKLSVRQPGQLQAPSLVGASGESGSSDTEFLGEGFSTRTAGGRNDALRAGGGNSASEQAVASALKWLAEHQNSDGSWSFNHTPGDNCSNFLNPGGYRTKMGATGLALFPFLGAGHTHQKKSIYQKTVADALHYLVENQQSDGALADEKHSTMYSHGIAACAIAEAYGMTRDKWLATPAQAAIGFILKAQDSATGGWRYKPRQGSDTSVVGWQLMCLKSALAAKLSVNPNVGLGVTKWLDSVQYDFPKNNQKGIGSKYGYTSPGSSTSATSSIGLLCRIYLGTPQNDPGLQLGLQYFANRGPEPNIMYANYYTTMFMFQCDGPKGNYWTQWNRRMRGQLLATQVRNGVEKGSWFFGNNWNGGRVYDTALSALTLQVYYRYQRFYAK